MLTSDNRKSVYIPEGFAHGFQTLEDNTEGLYLMSKLHRPEAERACGGTIARWDRLAARRNSYHVREGSALAVVSWLDRPGAQYRRAC